MTTRIFLRTLFVLAAVLVLAAPTVRARPTTPSEWVSQAEEHVRKRRYEAAVDAYMQAYEASRNPGYLYNAAFLCLRKLNDPLRAWTLAVRFREGSATEQDRQDAEALIREAEARLAGTHGKVVVRRAQPGTTVWLDARTEDARVVYAEAWATKGAHRVLAEAKGFEPAEVPITVEAGATVEVALDLKPIHAVLKVQGPVEGGAVLVDGKSLGPLPFEHALPPGRHEVRVVAEGREPFEQVIDLAPGEKLVLVAALAPRPVPATPEPVKTPTLPARARPHGPDRTWAFVSFGGAGVLVVTGTVLYFLGRKDILSAGDLNQLDYPDYAAFSDAFDSRVNRGKPKIYAGFALWGLGAAALGTGVVLYLVADHGSGAALAPSGPDGSPGLTACVRW